MFAVYEPNQHGHPSESPVTIRDAKLDDTPAMTAISATRGRVDGAYTSRLAASTLDPMRWVIVACLDGDVVGWAGAWHIPTSTTSPAGTYVTGLTVHPAARRRGAGLALLSELLARTSTRHETLWSIVSAANPASLDLHQRLGFVEHARGPAFAGVTFDCGEGVLLCGGVDPATDPQDSEPQ